MNVFYLFLFASNIFGIKHFIIYQRLTKRNVSYIKLNLQKFESYIFEDNENNTNGCDERPYQNSIKEEADIAKIKKSLELYSILKDLENKKISNITKLKIIEEADIFDKVVKPVSLISGGLFDDFLILFDL
jgi:hypothetical protein